MEKKKPRKEHNPKMTIVWLLVMFAFIGELLFYTWCRVQYVRVNYVITKQTARAKELSDMQGNLEIELAHLTSPPRIKKMAREQLGLVIPSPEQTIILP